MVHMHHVTVTTAIELTADQRKDVLATAAAKLDVTQKEIELEEVVDSTVIGGVRLTLNSRQYDATVQGKLNQLRSSE